MEQRTGSKLVKEYIKTVYCHPVYLIYMKSMSGKILVWNRSIVPCLVLTVAFWPAYRFLKREVRWSGILISFRIFHSLFYTVKGFGLVNKAKEDAFLLLSCFFNDPEDVGNLISGSSAFSKSSLNTWNFTVHVLLSWRILSITLLVCEMRAILL